MQGFLQNLQNPLMLTAAQMRAQNASQMRRLIGSESQDEELAAAQQNYAERVERSTSFAENASSS